MTKSKNNPSKVSRESLGPSQRIRREWEFKFVFDHGKFAKGSLFHLWSFQDKEKKLNVKGPRLGVIVGRKVHLRANVRNLWKRRIREIFRRNQQKLQPETHLLLQARTAKNVPTYAEMQREFEKLLEKTGSLK